jgi:DNA-binding transcriptional MocR family regulator
MPDESIRRGLRQLARGAEANLVSHDQPLGFPPLRAQIARRLAEKGIEAGADQVVLVDSATQALDLLCRFLLEPGDTVLVDDPCYFNYHGLLRAQRARVVGVPMTPNGPDLATLATHLAEHRPRFYVINSALQNPTGSTLAPAIAHRILKLAEAHDTLIIEDDIFGDFEGEPSPRLAGFDGLERVVQIGSFSKTLSAAIRCGFIALREDWVEPLTDLKLALNLGNSHLSASLMHGLLTDGTYRRHLAEVREKLGRAMAPALRRLERCGLTAWLEPSGGFFLWMRLPDGIDSANVARHALAHGLVLAPGGAFSPSSLGNSFLRFNVAQCTDPRMISMLETALAECRTAQPEQAA